MPFWDAIQGHGDRIACVTEDGFELTYSLLAARSDEVGFAALQRQTVLIEMDNTPDALAAYLGALRAGHAAILINKGDPVAAERLAATFQPGAHWVDGRLELRETAPIPPHPDLRVMLSTSGSTGSSKLVRLSAKAVDANASSIVEYLGITTADRAITSLVPAYSYGLSVLNSHLAAGASLLLTDRSVIDPGFRRMMDEGNATSIACVPYTIDLLESSGFLARMPAGLRTITQAGGRLAPEKVLRLGQICEEASIRFYVMYGQTEATARIAWLPPHLRDSHPDCIGQAIPGGRLWLRDPDSGVKTDSRGELIYSGPNVMMGYAETVADLARGHDITDLPTGDLAERVSAQIFRIVGRKSRFAKIFGLRISFDEIEGQLGQDGIVAVATGTDDRIVVALPEGQQSSTSAAELAARYKLPENRIAVVTVLEIPRLPTGKIDFQAINGLAPSLEEPDDQGPFEAYGRLLIRLNGGTPPAPTISFDELRSDSLSFVEASILLEQALGDLPDGWQTLAFTDLRHLAGAAHRRSRKPGFVVGKDILIRVIAILMIIIGHGLGSANQFLKGGSDVLIMVSGYALARYSGPRLLAGASGSVILDNLKRILPIIITIFILYSLLVRPLPIYYWLFVQNYFNDHYITFYWFLSAWMQCVAFVASLFLIPAIREQQRRNPVALAFALLTLAVALKFAAYLWSDPALLRFRQFDQILVFFLTGWVLFVARNATARLTAIAMAAFCSLTAWGFSDSHAWLLLGATLYLAFGSKLHVPTFLSRPVQAIALSSLYIYLLGAVPTLILWKINGRYAFNTGLTASLHFVATIGLGVGAGYVIRWAGDRWNTTAAKRHARTIAMFRRGSVA